MNILYIDHYAGSVSMGMEFRPYYLAREWQKKGHNVCIVTASFAHLRKNNPEVTKDFSITEIDGIDYQWIKTNKYAGNGVKRVITMMQFCWKLNFHASRIAKEFKPDIVIASSTYPMDAYAARKIADKCGAKYVHEVHDMWPITPIDLYGMSPKHPFVIIVQHAEDYFCKKADKVVSILPCAKDYFIEHGMRADKFLYVANGIDLGDWETPEALPEVHLNAISKAREQGRFVLVFFGSHTRSYCLDHLIKAASKIDPSKLFIAFVGEGNYKDELKAMAEEMGLDKDSYAFLPSVNKKAIPSLLIASDASYIGAIKNRMFRFGIGMNKLFDAMMGGKPILYAVDAPNDFAKDYDCGISVPAEDVDALKNGIEELINMSPDELKRLGDNGHNAVLNNFTYPVLAEKFLGGVE
ncbi:MAG: glycosyltransferase family 4 protein [Saccharofermentans sp.]|nr:glycosyltransferase family 4 protein [Saccharofermentans sp.]